MNIYEENDYRRIVKTLVQERKSVDPQASFQNLAEATRIPKSYLSRVLSGHHDFSCDQLFVVASHLGMDDDQISYLMLLLERTRSAVAERKSSLDHKIRTLQARKREVRENIRARVLSDDESSLAKYYQDPLNQIVHVCLAIERFAKEPGRLAGVLRIQKSRLVSIISSLESIGVIAQTNDGLKVMIDSVHLPRDSDLHDRWRDQLKVSSLRRIDALSREQPFTFSAAFTGDNGSALEIRAILLAAIRDIETKVDKAKNEEAFQLNVDFFPLTGDAALA